MSMPPSPFRYFRDPHHFSNYDNTGERCPFCGLIRAGYGGVFYGLDNNGYDFICEVCLLEGRLAEKGLTINEGTDLRLGLRLRHTKLLTEEADALIQQRTAELEQRTPSITTWQDLFWPSHCGDFCCFVKEAGQRDMQQLAPDGDGRRFFEDHMEERQEDVWETIRPDAPVDNSTGYSVGVYLFQCLECSQYLIQWDCN
jgi:uncharacterized protein CbrC (UPF0167 family)